MHKWTKNTFQICWLLAYEYLIILMAMSFKKQKNKNRNSNSHVAKKYIKHACPCQFFILQLSKPTLRNKHGQKTVLY